ncbi:PQQ-like beta-propeller repeat protein [Acidisoma cladoniae]|uniref:PQQ-like beta-propeller repeat protein n=1 Tax=Acidisoma cladoniae TaxID=3040935 RepID=UPI002550A963|nr:PQQ-like beta-propeller repeat protein [Acidisoma sp. PAMC 29798]
MNRLFRPKTGLSVTGNADSLRLTRRAALGLPLALAGCGFIGNDQLPPLPGKRIDVMQSTSALAVDPSMTGAVGLPPATSGTDWAQQGSNAAHSPGHPAYSGSLNQIWSADIGQGTAYRQRIPCPPIVAEGAVYTMSARGDVRAFALADGGLIWHSSIRPKGSRSTDIGGGISYDSGRIYAATGLGEILCFAAKDGAILYRQPLGAPARSAPTIAGKHMYLCLIDSSIIGLDTATGKTLWSHQATVAQTNVLGLPSPAVSGNIVVGGFGSGDLLALDATSGEVLWSDNLGATGTGLSQLSAIVGLPVIDQGRVFVGSLGGISLCMDLPTGRRLWEKDFATDQTPAVAGDWVFETSTDQLLGAISADSGSVRWVRQLPAFKNVKKSNGQIYWWGPVLAGNSLLLAGTNKSLISVDVGTGAITNAVRLPTPAAVTPVVAQGKVFVTVASGALLAFE